MIPHFLGDWVRRFHGTTNSLAAPALIRTGMLAPRTGRVNPFLAASQWHVAFRLRGAT